jgi:hypothetical protein
MCDDTTLCQRDFQYEATNIESDEDLEPYKTPVVLQKKKKKVSLALVIKSSEAEDFKAKQHNQKGVKRRKNKEKSSVADSTTHEVSVRARPSLIKGDSSRAETETKCSDLGQWPRALYLFAFMYYILPSATGPFIRELVHS